MKRIILFLVAAALILPGFSRIGQDSPEKFLPASKAFDDWTREEPPEIYTRQQLYGHINGGAEIFLQYRFEELALANYSRSDAEGKEEITCEIYRMFSPENAFGIFSIQRAGGETVSPKIKAPNWTSDMQVSAVKDHCFVNITGFGTDGAAIEDFTAYVISLIPGEPAVPPVFNRFPMKKMLTGSHRLILGPLASAEESLILQDPLWAFAGETAAFSARYEPANSKAVLVDFAGPPPSLEIVAEVFRRYLDNVTIEKGLLSGKNPIGRLFLCAIKGQEAALVLGEPDPEFALFLLTSLLNPPH